jgi:hypothetical protein
MNPLQTKEQYETMLEWIFNVIGPQQRQKIL